ncbi:MAG: hypothetical protein LBQ12_04245 [Deltaproteobacteria bacterium]|nr:hypothetical protein [Deltaproteobacteria bacterium]
MFAYANGDEICTESYFTRKNRVVDGRIAMQDASGTEIGSASTGADGNRCFPAPPGEGDLKFVVLAGEGHRGEFTLPAADRPGAPSAAEGGAGPGRADPAATGSGPSPDGAAADGAGASGEAASPGAPAGVSEETLRAVVREELKAQISPVVRALAEARDGGTPGLREIVGGLGWVAGVCGLVLWLKRRPGAPGRKD